MKELKFTGGARIGMFISTFPFATLKVNSSKLELNASIFGNLTFQLCDIRSIEPYVEFPLIFQGIKINHNVKTYNEEVIFLTFENPKDVINQIWKIDFFNKNTFVDNALKTNIVKMQERGGYPTKKSFSIGLLVVWNLLYFTEFVKFFMKQSNEQPYEIGIILAFGLLFVISIMSLTSANFRSLILKEGRNLEDIKRITIFILFLSGIVLLNSGIMQN